MPTPANLLNSIRVVQGQTKVLDVVVKTCEGRLASLNGATLYFTVRSEVGGAVVFRCKSPDDGIMITDAANGEATITISSTKSDVAPGCYLYDLWVEFSGSPPIRHPVVKKADLTIEVSLADFS
jgi:hypothetical protein